MNIILFSRRNSAHVASQIADIFAALDRYGFDYSINEEFAEASRDTAGIVVDPGRIYPAHRAPHGDVMMRSIPFDGYQLPADAAVWMRI